MSINRHQQNEDRRNQRKNRFVARKAGIHAATARTIAAVATASTLLLLPAVAGAHTAMPPTLKSAANSPLLKSAANSPLLKSAANSPLLKSAANSPLLNDASTSVLVSAKAGYEGPYEELEIAKDMIETTITSAPFCATQTTERAWLAFGKSFGILLHAFGAASVFGIDPIDYYYKKLGYTSPCSLMIQSGSTAYALYLQAVGGARDLVIARTDEVNSNYCEYRIAIGINGGITPFNVYTHRFSGSSCGTASLPS
jgi:hypothetical protein